MKRCNPADNDKLWIWGGIAVIAYLWWRNRSAATTATTPTGSAVPLSNMPDVLSTPTSGSSSGMLDVFSAPSSGSSSSGVTTTTTTGTPAPTAATGTASSTPGTTLVISTGPNLIALCPCNAEQGFTGPLCPCGTQQQLPGHAYPPIEILQPINQTPGVNYPMLAGLGADPSVIVMRPPVPTGGNVPPIEVNPVWPPIAPPLPNYPMLARSRRAGGWPT